MMVEKRQHNGMATVAVVAFRSMRDLLFSRPCLLLVALALALALGFAACAASPAHTDAGRDTGVDARPSCGFELDLAGNQTYDPTEESLARHPLPAWYAQAKLGIMVHWGLYSVPAWAPPTGELNQVVQAKGWDYWFANNPYAEWYQNSIQIPGSPSAEHHAATCGASACDPYAGHGRRGGPATSRNHVVELAT